MESKLFRAEALNAKQTQAVGRVILIRPLSLHIALALSLTTAAVVLCFLFMGEYTKRTKAVGFTEPEKGIQKLFAPQPGIVLERLVKEGQQVRSGDSLFILSTERMTLQDGMSRGTQASIASQLLARRTSLEFDRSRIMELAAEDAHELRRKIEHTDVQIGQIDIELALFRDRIHSLESQYSRLNELAEKGFYSQLALQQKLDELFEQKTRLQSSLRSKSELISARETLLGNLNVVPIKGARDASAIDREIALLEQDRSVTEANRQVVITAPTDSIVTAILAEPGQYVSNQPLLTLLPKNGLLEVHLFVPSRAIGFIENGQSVQIRFLAYPYQKFGQQLGTVRSVARAALNPAELPPQLQVLSQQSADTFFPISITLVKQSISAYGQEQQLTSGMQVEADIFQDRRTLFEWTLEPLYTLTGKK